MKAVRKVWSFVLVIALLCPMFSLLPFSASAESGSIESSDTVTVNTSMKTVTVDFYMTTTKVIEDFQGYITFDTDFLEIESNDKITNYFKGKVQANVKNGKIYFAGMNVDTGFDFSGITKIFSAEFTVLQNGSPSVSSVITIADEKPLVEPSDDTLIVDYENNINKGYVDTTVVINPLRISGANLALEADLTVNFYVNSVNVEGFTNVYLKADGRNVYGNYDSSTGRYKFQLKGINPACAGLDLKAALYGTKNGIEYSTAEISYSVVQYCKNQFANIAKKTELTAEDTAFRTMMVHLLNYCAAAQVFNSDDSELANAFLTDEQKAWATVELGTPVSHTNATYATVDSPLIKWKGISLILSESVDMNMYFQLNGLSDLSGVSVQISELDGSQNWTIDNLASVAVPKDNGAYYAVSFKGLFADQMSDQVLIKFVKNGQVISNTAKYSIESYVASKYDGSGSALSNLVAEMFKYGKSSVLYKSAKN